MAMFYFIPSFAFTLHMTLRNVYFGCTPFPSLPLGCQHFTSIVLWCELWRR